MSSEGPTFRWDTYGLTAFDAYWSDIDGTRIITDINTSKFVRFDKHGIYGVNNYPGVKGSSWVPKDAAELDRVSTFSLTWDGLKVTGSGNIVAKIGRSNDSIIKITNNNENLLMVTNEGDLRVAGEIIAKSGIIGGFTIGTLNEVPCLHYRSESDGYLNVTPYSLVLAPTGISWGGSIGGSPESLTWKMIVGEKFGTTSNGTVYAVGGVFTDMTIKNKLIVESKLDFSKIGFAEVYDGEIARTSKDYKIRIPEPKIVNSSSGNGNIHFDISWNELYPWNEDNEEDYVLITYTLNDGYTVADSKFFIKDIFLDYDGRAKISCMAEIGGGSNIDRFSIRVGQLTGITSATGFKVGGGFLPASTKTYILGSPDYTWKEVYVDTLYATNVEEDFTSIYRRITALEQELAELKSKI
jgi:hypothetical protein